MGASMWRDHPMAVSSPEHLTRFQRGRGGQTVVLS